MPLLIFAGDHRNLFIFLNLFYLFFHRNLFKNNKLILKEKSEFENFQSNTCHE